MNELIPIKKWLEDQKGRRTTIARNVGMNIRTIQRIAAGEVKSVNLATYSKLKAEMEKPVPRIAVRKIRTAKPTPQPEQVA